MDNRERIALWVIVGLLAVGLVVSVVMITGELQAINDVLAARQSAEPVAATPEHDPMPKNDPPIAVGITGTEVLSDTMTMTVTVRYSGQGDLLYEPPEVVDAAGNTYPITGESLEEAKFAFLDLVTAGQVTTQLTFAGAPQGSARLVFNPNQPQSNSLIAPKTEANVPLGEHSEGE
jgi:hypothetical protein